MYNIIPLILILLSLSVIIFIVARKFSLLANLDVANIPAEKEARMKERIISSRFRRHLARWSSWLVKFSRFVGQQMNVFLKWSQNKLHELKEGYRSETILLSGNRSKKINEFFSEAEELEKQGDYKEAEKRLIEIIGLDSRNIKAFETLGRFYLEEKNYEEAEQTFAHILKLLGEGEENSEHRAEIYFNLSLISQAKGDLKISLETLKKALELGPNNPRYLDTALEISIMVKDKISALAAYEKLKEVNPENQKLVELEKQINEL